MAGNFTHRLGVFNPSASGPVNTWSSARKTTNMTLSDGDQTATVSVAAVQCVGATNNCVGKSYFEVHIITLSGNNRIGIARDTFGFTTTDDPAVDAGSGVYIANGEYWSGGVLQSSGNPTFTAGDVIMVAFDDTSNKFWFGKNGTWTGDPAAGTGEVSTLGGTMVPVYRPGTTGNSATFVPHAAGQTYSPPSGFSPYG